MVFIKIDLVDKTSPLQSNLLLGKIEEIVNTYARVMTKFGRIGRIKLDVCLNKPFKDRVRQKWMAWMAEEIHELTAGGRQKKTSTSVSVDRRSVA